MVRFRETVFRPKDREIDDLYVGLWTHVIRDCSEMNLKYSV